jgi:hypothetical protein
MSKIETTATLNYKLAILQCKLSGNNFEIARILPEIFIQNLYGEFFTQESMVKELEHTFYSMLKLLEGRQIQDILHFFSAG